MIPEPRFPAEPWQVRETEIDFDQLAQAESVFALSNGHIGVRGNFDEGDPSGLPGTYLNSFYEVRPLPYAESGFGYPESGQTVLNVTDGKVIRLLVDDEPLDLRYGEIVSHERVLDLRAGLLRRTLEWCSPAGTRIRVRSERLVSFSQRSIMAIRYVVEPVDDTVRVVLNSELVANQPLPPASGDPRVAAVLDDALEAVQHAASEQRGYLLHRTRGSQLLLAAAMSHDIDCAGSVTQELAAEPDLARLTVATRLEPGSSLTLTKYVAYGWSAKRTAPALRDQVQAALITAVNTGWDDLLAEQRNALDDFWDGADVEIDGPEEIQQASRFGMFHAFQASARAEQRAIPAKGLTGSGYDGHAFWDTEAFVLPLLTATAPRAAADALRWRHATLDLARERARMLNFTGAAFPWRTIRGQECSAYWPAGTAAMHVNADIAVATARYVRWTGDSDFERDHAVPILIETARLWMHLGYDGDDGRFHIDGVTGPDEYTAVIDDNAYTNLMAAQNLQFAADVVRRWPEQAADLGITEAEVDHWRSAASRIALHFDGARGVHQQDRGFTDRQVWDFEASAKEGGYPLLTHAPYFALYRQQVVKQADLVLAMHWATDAFTAEQKAHNFAYYDALTVRDSSLSACTQAVIAAEVGHLDLAASYLAEAALIDLDDLEHNARDGLHIAALSGAWLALVAGFGGLRDQGEHLLLRPQLPQHWRRMAFGLRVQQSRLKVEITPGTVTYSLTGEEPLTLRHVSVGTDELLTLADGESVQRQWSPVVPLTPRPHQPAGRPPVTLSKNGAATRS
ncbi:glycosyl hydrolase family 65 protein [Jatrophihabitans sp.]|uniref:glycoside hydrolase family 65 protein n=1 Tax=Jatrophihabitans sp. TaxID=1932789 RepID=UPI0030C73BC4|nr:family 65 glycosyl hydrolase [Jatrophihabitans sp.]